MKFDPAYFVKIAHDFGVEITREGKTVRYTSGDKAIKDGDLWINAITENRRELLDFLPNTAKQLDLFDDPYI